MSDVILYTTLLISPLVIGGIIAGINTESVNNTTEKAEAWARKTHSKVTLKKGWFSRYIIQPILWLLVKFSDWTDGFVHRGLKNGTRVAATLYLIAAWCFIIYVAFMIALILAVSALIIYIIFKILINSNDDVKQGYDKGRRIVGSVGPGKRINQDTGIIQEEGMFGYKDTDQRIDPETGKIQKEGLFGWNDTETRINQETGNIQKEGLFGYNDTETRINPDTGIIQKNGMLGWQDTDERINTETGKHQKNGMLGWQDD